MLNRRHALAALPTLVGAAALAASPSPTGRVLPATVRGERFFLDVPLARGGTVRALLSSAGVLYGAESLATRLGVTRAVGSGRRLAALRAPWTTVFGAQGLPAPGAGPAELVFMAADGQDAGILDGAELVLGAPWFAQRSWTWDGRAGSLTWWPPGARPASAATAPVGFARNAAGQPSSHFARLMVQVAGETLALLFDTGAAVQLAPASLAALQAAGDRGPALRAVCRISAATAARWHQTHPDWPWLDAVAALDQPAMIRVPGLSLAGVSRGPLWFAAMSDATLADLSGLTDRPLQGTLGASALSEWRLTLDYRAATVTVET
jgi:hypothetical protein